MSNHSGSYMLNNLLKMLDKYSVFDTLGKRKTQALALEIITMSYHYDCNPDEILEDLGEHLGVCYYCESPADEFHDGICKKCHDQD